MAHHTFVRFLASMSQMVVDSRSRILKRLWAILALERALSSMYTNMNLEVLLQRESFATIAACESLDD